MNRHPSSNRTKTVSEVGNFTVLVCDKDGTLTDGDRLASRTRQGLQRWMSTGRRLMLATGETMEELLDFADLELFDLVVAENGALLFSPKTRLMRVLTERCPPALVKALK